MIPKEGLRRAKMQTDSQSSAYSIAKLAYYFFCCGIFAVVITTVVDDESVGIAVFGLVNFFLILLLARNTPFDKDLVDLVYYVSVGIAVVAAFTYGANERRQLSIEYEIAILN